MSRNTRILATASLLTLAACGSSSVYGTTSPPPSTQPSGTVDATAGLAFTPRTVTISAGQSVTFRFSSVAHDVIFDTQNTGTPTDIGGGNTNVSIQRTFTTPGTYQYHCDIHPSMTGSVVVG
jgi:plastocyanin